MNDRTIADDFLSDIIRGSAHAQELYESKIKTWSNQ